MSSYSSPETGDFDKYFMTTTDLIDRFAIGTLWIWGNNYSGQLGDNTTGRKSSPIQTICGGTSWKSASCGINYSASIKTDGTLWTWGLNIDGQLGDNTTVSKSSPVQTICQGNDWKLVSCGYYHTVGIKTDGTLWLWGRDAYGQLGDDSYESKSSPIQTVSGGTSWKMVSCGYQHTGAIKTDGTLWLWGQDTYGQLGDNATVNKSSPVQTICQGNNWKSVSCGYRHTAGIKTDGTLWLWGQNDVSQLGNNATVNKSSPVQTICEGTSWKSVSCGYGHSAAIKTDGTLWLWGWDVYGQLGDDSYESKSSPVQTICQGNNWKLVSCGYGHTAGIKTDGSLWTWGYNYYGSLGNGYTENKPSPVQTISGGTSWKTVSCSFNSSLATQFSNFVKGIE